MLCRKQECSLKLNSVTAAERVQHTASWENARRQNTGRLRKKSLESVTTQSDIVLHAPQMTETDVSKGLCLKVMRVVMKCKVFFLVLSQIFAGGRCNSEGHCV